MSACAINPAMLSGLTSRRREFATPRPPCGVPFRENAPDKRVHFLRLLRRRCTSRANGPNRLVGDDDTVEVRGCQPAESAV